MARKILVVDDEKSIVKALCYALKKEGYEVGKAFDGIEALKVYEVFKPDMIILDIMMPRFNGYDFCKKIMGEKVWILMVTAKTDVIDKVLGLELGADDYITKPFDIRELLARVKSGIRRMDKSMKEGQRNTSIRRGELELIYENRQAILRNEDMELTPKEFLLLYELLANPNKVYSRDELLDKVWGMEYVGGTRTVDTHIQRLRRKLGKKYEKLIYTVHGVGYKGRADI
ncbi:response regulator transcription factor [Maledivibacter halophilus]|uniref:Stage 0 sporulation protein A homolog n=1 Tax=Maledivibacter halophilus TaxID=36842 RepID=A0A1T5MNA9_9FIRM|nr:response regulator transcription factor [Maledivibacter halophilus]SKC89369.1 DNA-binding response regulator, OmpR family, contains REC and winged-helix (wHTH) domain [Maledivibacter halophilus]